MSRWWDDLCAADITAHVIGVLRTRHLAPEWAVFDEFCGGTGTSSFSDTRIDFLAVHLWADRKHKGGHVVAYEIKATRGDFSRELAHPEKRACAERIASDCYFATPVGLVRVDEIPEGWGLLEVTDGARVRVAKHAQQRALASWPWPIMLSLARRVHRSENPADGCNRERGLLLWHLQGLNLTEEQFNEAVDKHYEEKIKRAQKEAVWNAVDKFKEGDEYKHLRAMEDTVREIVGPVCHRQGARWGGIEPDDLRAWIAEHVGQTMTPHLRSLLVALRDGVDAALKEDPCR